QSFSRFKPHGTSALQPATGCPSGIRKPSNPFCCLKKAGVLHETAAFFAVHVRSDELGGRGRFLLLRYRKEGRVVEEQVLTHSQEVAEQNLQIESITDLSRFITRIRRAAISSLRPDGRIEFIQRHGTISVIGPIAT